MSKKKSVAAGIAFVILGALVGCHVRIKPLPPKPTFATVHHLTKTAHDVAASQKKYTKSLSDAFDSHSNDTRPTRVFIAENVQAVHTIRDNATILLDKVDAIEPATVAVEKQSDTAYAATVEYRTELVATTQALEKEKNSWFGGRIGRLLWWTLVGACFVSACWGISKLILLFGPASWLTSPIAGVFHVIANLLESAFLAANWCIKSTWSAIVWFWNEIILKHIPWTQAELAAKSTLAVSSATLVQPITPAPTGAK